jgi:uroporphyrinogen decarboxylase
MALIEAEFMELTRDLDVAAFWAEDKLCQAMHTTQKPRCPISLGVDDHWLFEFLGVTTTNRYYHDKAYRDSLHRESNALTRQHLGKPFFDEDTWEHQPKRIENLFGAEFAYHDGGTPWFVSATDDPAEFARILDRAEVTNVKEWALPEPFRREWEARKAAGKSLPHLGTGSRGPATIMTSVLRPETVFFWIYDHPELMRRFRDVLKVKMVELNRALRAFSGHTQPGWWITDDNCALFSRELYRKYCFPILERVLNEFASGGWRYQHSDSDMAHLLDQQYELGIRRVNYGPNIDVALIRARMPDAEIHGRLPPFLLRNGSPEAIRVRVRGDFEKAGGTGAMVLAGAGSIAGGTGLGRLRWFMKCVQECCRYGQG